MRAGGSRQVPAAMGGRAVLVAAALLRPPRARASAHRRPHPPRPRPRPPRARAPAPWGAVRPVLGAAAAAADKTRPNAVPMP